MYWNRVIINNGIVIEQLLNIWKIQKLGLEIMVKLNRNRNTVISSVSNFFFILGNILSFIIGSMVVFRVLNLLLILRRINIKKKRMVQSGDIFIRRIVFEKVMNVSFGLDLIC